MITHPHSMQSNICTQVSKRVSLAGKNRLANESCIGANWDRNVPGSEAVSLVTRAAAFLRLLQWTAARSI